MFQQHFRHLFEGMLPIDLSQYQRTWVPSISRKVPPYTKTLATREFASQVRGHLAQSVLDALLTIAFHPHPGIEPTMTSPVASKCHEHRRPVCPPWQRAIFFLHSPCFCMNAHSCCQERSARSILCVDQRVTSFSIQEASCFTAMQYCRAPPFHYRGW